MNARFSIDTAPGVRGAVAVLRVSTDDAEVLFGRLGMRPIKVGGSAVRSVLGADRALVARPTPGTLIVMPHGGGAIVRTIAEGLTAGGITESDRGPGGAARSFVEAGSQVEAAMLEALSRAASPLAIDLLLDQPRRWAAHRSDDALAHAAVLNHLIEPALVVAVGAANIGKSSLLNAVAQGSVALAFDLPGTTRDAVGVLVDLGGLVVRWMDTPGLIPGDAAAAAAVEREMAAADLVLRCADGGSDGPATDAPSGTPSLVVALRADRAAPRFAVDVVTSVVGGQGLDAMAGAIRRSLMPDEALNDQRPWKFWKYAANASGA